MAKRKRASLKDKSPETLGMTQNKGKGIDLLFGGSSDVSTDEDNDSANLPDSSEAAAFIDDDLSGLISSDEGLVDELGLPVALEAPPDDLILASAPVTPTSNGGDEDPVNSATSPFALPDLDNVEAASLGQDARDLSGILDDEDLPIVEEEDKLANSEKENDLTGTEARIPPGSVNEDDLSGLAADDTLSGLVVEDDLSGLVEDSSAGVTTEGFSGPGVNDLSGLTTAEGTNGPQMMSDATDLSGLVGEEGDLSGLTTDSATTPYSDIPSATFSPPPTTAAPINVPPSSGTDTAQSTFPSAGYPAGTTRPGYSYPGAEFTSTPPTSTSPNIPPSSTAAGSPDLSAPRPRTIQFGEIPQGLSRTLSAFGDALPDSREGFLPRDELPDHPLTVRQREKVERDDAITEQVLRYIGPQRRDALFEEIQSLHERVSNELSGNKADISFALNALREANNYIIEDPREYDEALYLVALVKAMLNRKHSLTYWSYRLGLLILIYGILCTIAFIAGFLLPIDFEGLFRGDRLGLIFEAVWFSGLAGGLGGSVEIFWRLYYRVSVKQDFDPQYLMYYLVKPILGFVLGLIMYFLVGVSSVIIGGPGLDMPEAGAETGFILTIVLGFIAGFRQESVFDMIYVLIKKISPEAAGYDPNSVIPVEDLAIDYERNVSVTTSTNVEQKS